MRSCSAARNGVQHVGRGHEEHLRQVVVHVEIVILEGDVLLGVEHFEQRRRRIAAKVRRNLVHLVEQEHRILGSRALHVLDDLAGHGADVGPPMAANLSFVAHAAQRQPHELAPRGLGDRHAQRSFAHARRSDETQDRSLWDF